MQILSVRLRNIKSHRDISLDFAAGINVLSGPNGVGKSTVFEAIGYALFGVDARDFVSNIERFLTIGTRKGEISVTFRTDGHGTWCATRTVGGGSRWLLAKETDGAFEVEEHAGMEETEARLRELLGLENGRSLADQFKLVIGPFQNDFLGPFILKGQKRIDAFDEILGIDAWRKTYKGANILANEVKYRIDLLNAEIEEKQIKAAGLPLKAVELKGVIAVQKEKRGDLKTTEEALDGLSAQVKAFDLQREQLDKVHNELRQTQVGLESGREHIARQMTLVSQSETAVTLMENNRSGKEAFERAETQLAGLREQDQLRRSLERDFAELEKKVVRLAEKLEHRKREIDQTKEELAAEEKGLLDIRKSLLREPNLVESAGRVAEIRRELDNARVSRGLLEGKRTSLLEGREKLAVGICPFFQEPCRNIAGKEPHQVFTTRVENLDREMHLLDSRIERLGEDFCAAEKARQELDAIKVRFEDLEIQAGALRDRQRRNDQRAQDLERLRAEKVDADNEALGRRKELEGFAGLDGKIAATEKDRQMCQAARDGFYRHQQTAEELSRRRETLERYRQRLHELEETYKARQTEFTRLNEEYQPEQHQNAHKQKEDLLSTVAALKEQVGNLGKDRRRLEGEIEELNSVKQLVGLRLVEKKNFEEKGKLVHFLRESVFKKVSAQLSERFREEISLCAERIYRTISETDEELYWGENYQIILRDMAEGEVRERSDDQLSGGQIMSSVVALRLALLQTLGARVAFFDEPTSNLDALRRENLAHAFRAIDVGREEVTEHWYDQLFLISHDVAFTEVTDQMIQVGASDPHGG
jgi:exonuclease SbcC